MKSCSEGSSMGLAACDGDKNAFFSCEDMKLKDAEVRISTISTHLQHSFSDLRTPNGNYPHSRKAFKLRAFEWRRLANINCSPRCASSSPSSYAHKQASIQSRTSITKGTSGSEPTQDRYVKYLVDWEYV
ncbi:hypothetical protein M408DRAFT_116260 [Serendipita vermifera MAFF 305830]|uniref:Uncharacterized protein n=1 Tax=Serendipita vermifera MAFF 305830 TaxID=933852 RepID=A0A0C2XKT5_SERVB|nr:hypothetical protein M408DRAFT_116260 [Serendipita vermifera MAFF 305830]